MSALDPYIEVIFWEYAPIAMAFPEGFVRIGAHRDAVSRAVDEVLQGFEHHGLADKEKLTDGVIARMLDGNVFEIRTDNIAGAYYEFQKPRMAKVRQNFLTDSSIYGLRQEIGDQFYRDVLENFHGNIEPGTKRIAAAVPASDRIVTLQHNQLPEIEAEIATVEKLVEDSNGDPDDPGFRERILGEIRAGRELLRAGTFRAYLLWGTLLSALSALIERYAGSAVAVAAETLLSLLIEKGLAS